jgi:DHA1 family bicyclomycin/chloramphenicol resistance-like MFS transporter
MPRYFLPLLILSLIACCIEVDISVPSFPDMGHYFKVEDGLIQLTIASNLLGFSLGSALYGPLSDSYGRRPIMVWGNAILALGAIGCVIAPTISILLFTRFIQGIGAAASAVIVFAMIADVYTSKIKAASLIGSMNAVFTIFMAGAPLAGGFINEVVGWRGNYGIVATICLISWICLVFALPETNKINKRLHFPKIRNDYRRLLTNYTFISASLTPSLLYSAYLSFIAQASFLYIETFGLSLIEYVLHQAFVVLIFAIVSLFSGKITKKIGPKGSITKGLVLSGIGAISLAILSLTGAQSPNLMTLLMSLVSLGSAISYPVIFAASLEIFPEIKGTSSSVIMSMRAFLCFGFVAINGCLYNGDPLRTSFIVLFAISLGMFFTAALLRSKPFTDLLSPQGAS